MYLDMENAGNIAENHKFPLKGNLKVRCAGFREICENTLAEIDHIRV